MYGDDDHYIKAGPAHLSSLSRMIAGHESLEPVPANQSDCEVQPSRSSNIAVKAYTAQQCPNEGESWDYLTNPQPTANGSTASALTVTVWLRIYDQNGDYTPFYSMDDVHWVKGASWTLTSPEPTRFPIKIGLCAFASGTPGPVSAYFDYVHVYSCRNRRAAGLWSTVAFTGGGRGDAGEQRRRCTASIARATSDGLPNNRTYVPYLVANAAMVRTAGPRRTPARWRQRMPTCA